MKSTSLVFDSTNWIFSQGAAFLILFVSEQDVLVKTLNFSLYPLINKRIIASIEDFAKKFLHIYKTWDMDEEQSISHVL